MNVLVLIFKEISFSFPSQLLHFASQLLHNSFIKGRIRSQFPYTDMSFITVIVSYLQHVMRQYLP